MPVRKIPRSNRALRGRVTDSQGASHSFESSLERDLLEQLTFDPLVERFEVQPVRITYQHDGKACSYVPDVLIYWVGDKAVRNELRPTLVEVKFKQDFWSQWPQCKPKYRAAIRYCKENYWRFRIFTEANIRTHFLENARFLKRYLHPNASFDQDLANCVYDRVAVFDRPTIGEVINSIALTPQGRGRLYPTFWRMIATQQIHTDLSKPIDLNTRIWVVNL